MSNKINIKKNKEKLDFYFEDRVHLGYAYKEVDGYYVFVFINNQGSWSSSTLRHIAEIIDELNFEYDQQLKTYMNNNLDLTQKQGWNNRHTTPLPKHKCELYIIYNDVNGQHVTLCEWTPFDKSKYSENDMPGEGYLGTAKYIEGQYKGIGHHAWAQTNYEFIYWTFELSKSNENNSNNV